jgi:hypothetical protein
MRCINKSIWTACHCADETGSAAYGTHSRQRVQLGVGLRQRGRREDAVPEEQAVGEQGHHTSIKDATLVTALRRLGVEGLRLSQHNL